ncbi:MAG TPA: acyltransferase, partial [Planctomycetaceae bacterium]|nr:acyltransferase [Planctomycetaceae bacterium]
MINPNKKPISIAAIQMSCVSDKATNVAHAEKKIREAAQAGANVVCLQELFHGLYPCQTEEHVRF